jgi:hypothetical protein
MSVAAAAVGCVLSSFASDLLLTPNRLLGVTVITAFCADYCKFFIEGTVSITDQLIVLVVASIEETADRYSIPKPFIGLILLPIVVCDLISYFLRVRN